jgi:hypothetical protein
VWTNRKFSVQDRKITDVSQSFKFGTQATKRLSLLNKHYNISKLDDAQKFSYEHPFLRYVVDLYTTEALAAMEKPFTDIGSKYHKIANIYKGRFTALRPSLFPYDEFYKKKYSPAYYPQVLVSDAAADEYSVMDTDMLSIDSIYYPGVF